MKFHFFKKSLKVAIKGSTHDDTEEIYSFDIRTNELTKIVSIDNI